VLTVLVFVHELGHYMAARWCGVRVDVFSIGFGPILASVTDERGTRWVISAIPLGGYVKMKAEHEQPVTDGADTDSFADKTIGQRTLIVAAGPAINFLYAIVLFAAVFWWQGQPYTAPVVSNVVSGSAADRGGLRIGDRIIAINGQSINRFEDIQAIAQMNLGTPLAMVVDRAGASVDLTVTPDLITRTTEGGFVIRHGRIGIASQAIETRSHNILSALLAAFVETWRVCSSILLMLGDYIAGHRPANELAGPLGIAQMSGQVAQAGLVPLLLFSIYLSINLGLLNLMPIPMLDGGRLVFYAVEAVRGRPLGERAQEFGYGIGLAAVLFLFLFTTWNDISRLAVFDFLSNIQFSL
jgi:regulator of sigma E protease